MPTTVRSHAKINLGLYIGAPRPDGFHSLVTVYQTLELHDLVTVSAKMAGVRSIHLSSNDQRVPIDAQNTAWKMTVLALERMSVHAEVAIHIEKRLPIQGGLGAGSANAVATLIGLDQELFGPGNGSPFTWAEAGEPLGLAAQVGSDVPLFLIGGTIFGIDRGQEVYPLPDLVPMWCVIATPAIGVSTPQAFRDWDALCAAEGLTNSTSTGKLNRLSRTYASAFAGVIPWGGRESGSSGVPTSGGDLAGSEESALVRTGITSWIENDFERVVFPQHPSLAEIKRLLRGPDIPEAARPVLRSEASSLTASLSGSGSTLFGLYPTQGSAQAAQQRLTAAGVESRITRTLPRSEYWAKMIVD